MRELSRVGYPVCNSTFFFFSHAFSNRKQKNIANPLQFYTTLINRQISPRMVKNAENLKSRLLDLVKNDEDIMAIELEKALKNWPSFIRSVELLKAPPVSASVLCRGHDIVVAKPDEPEHIPPDLAKEDARMRALASIIVSNDHEAPKNLLWPYLQHELLKKHKGQLNGEVKSEALKIMERDAGNASKFTKVFFWEDNM